MNALVRLLAAAMFLAAAQPASAHTVFGVAGFWGGLMHPVVVPSHLMAVAALGLLAGGRSPRWGYGVPVAYAASVIVGLAAIALAYVPTRAEEALLALATISGLLAALAWSLPPPVGWCLAAALGLVLGLDSPPEGISLTDANLGLLGTALGAPAALLIVMAAAARLTRHWQRIGARILGSWIAASAILVLALRLVR